MDHQCEALVLICIDYRFQTFIRNWLVENGLENKYDLIARPGGGKDTEELLLLSVGLSLKLHGIKKVIVIQHQNCGAYGSELVSGSKEELDKHRSDLAISVELMRRRFPGLGFETYFMKLDGTIVNL